MNLLNYGLCLLTFAISLASAATVGHGHHARGHHDIARRVDGGMQLWKRYSGTRWTFYDVGLGACGKVNVPSDFIVALNAAQFGGGYPGPNCFKWITMSYNGKTARAQIMDMCPGCPYGGLDLSRGLFAHFGNLGLGVITGSWTFDGEGGDDGDSDDSPPPPTSTKKPSSRTRRPTSTRTSTRFTPTATSSLSSPTLSIDINSTTLSLGYSVSGVSGIPIPIPTNAPDGQGGNVENINEALVRLGGLAAAGAQAD